MMPEDGDTTEPAYCWFVASRQALGMKVHGANDDGNPIRPKAFPPTGVETKGAWTSTTGHPGAGADSGVRGNREQRPKHAHGNVSGTYAALDLGTNNCRLLVARPSRRGFVVVDAFSRIIRLGEGLGANGKLSQGAMDRTFDALRVCASKITRHGVGRSRLVATEACRVASNGAEFLSRVRRDLGLDIELLSREDEAKLAVSGCASLLDTSSDLALVFDIGGGSTELIWLDLSRRRGQWRRGIADRLEAHACIAAWTSLPVGVVTLADRFDGRTMGASEFEVMVEEVIRLISPFEAEHRFGPRLASERVHLLGTSGTVTTLAGIKLGLPRYDRSRVDGLWLSTEDLRHVTYDLVGKNYEQRVAEPCIGRDRADLVLAGCAILEALMRIWPTERLRVADRGLREGILSTLMGEDGFHREHGNGTSGR